MHMFIYMQICICLFICKYAYVYLSANMHMFICKYAYVAQRVASYKYYGKSHFSHLPIPKPTMSRPMSKTFLDVAIASTTAPTVSTIAQANSMGFRPHR